MLFVLLEVNCFSFSFQKNTEESVISGSTLVSVTDASSYVIPVNIVNIDHGIESQYVFQGSKDTLQKVSSGTDSNLQTIGEYSFFLCTRLEYVDLTYCTKLKEIHAWAFSYCYSLRTFLFPSSSSISFICSNVFRCVPLNATLDLSSVYYLSSDPFVNTSLSFTCSKDNSILSEYENNIYNKNLSILYLVSFSTQVLKIHPDTTIISDDAFGSSSLKEIILPQQITTINRYGFHRNEYVEKVVLPQEMKTINTYLFSYLPKLEILYIPEGIASIETKFIEHCPKIKIIHIPSSLKHVSNNSFIVPTLKYVTYEQSQYEMLLFGGIPRYALLAFKGQICPTYPPSFVKTKLHFFVV